MTDAALLSPASPTPPAAAPGPPAAGPATCPLDRLAVLAIDGEDAAAFLQGQLSGDVNALGPAGCQYTSYNSPKGRMLANFVLWRSDAGFRALLPGELAEPVAKRLKMYVLRSKVRLADVSADTARFGVGGPGAADAVRAALGAAPPPFATASTGTATILGLPGGRYVVVAPQAAAADVDAALRRHATPAGFGHWQWLTIRAGIPIVTLATQDQFVAQTANWDALSGISFGKGCYTGQEIIARMQYLGRLKERAFLFHAAHPGVAAGARLFSTAFGDQPCGTVVNAAPAPGGGCDLVAVLQLAAADAGDVRLDAPDGEALAPLPLPYPLPEPAAPRGRLA
jgi:folate-binding protein YgfZ